MASIAGDSLTSSVPPLKAKPNAPTVFPRNVHRAASTFAQFRQVRLKDRNTSFVQQFDPINMKDQLRICAAGSVYVGLVAALGFAEIGHSVVCVDVDNDAAPLDSQPSDNRQELCKLS